MHFIFSSLSNIKKNQYNHSSERVQCRAESSYKKKKKLPVASIIFLFYGYYSRSSLGVIARAINTEKQQKREKKPELIKKE